MDHLSFNNCNSMKCSVASFVEWRNENKMKWSMLYLIWLKLFLCCMNNHARRTGTCLDSRCFSYNCMISSMVWCFVARPGEHGMCRCLYQLHEEVVFLRMFMPVWRRWHVPPTVLIQCSCHLEKVARAGLRHHFVHHGQYCRQLCCWQGEKRCVHSRPGNSYDYLFWL